MKELDKCGLVERSINKKFRKGIWNKFIEGVRNYELIQPNDKIAVCMSGGKDSMLLAKLMQELKRHSDIPFELEFVVMDPGYSPKNREKIISNAELLRVPIRIYDTNIFTSVEHIEKSPCYICARMRRGYLYRFARELGCNKIALGHHYNDVIETVLMGLLYGGQYQTMMPKLHSTNFPGMELIRPMYCVGEDDIIAWRNYNELEFLQCACRFTEKIADENAVMESKRQEMKRLINSMKEEYPQVEANIFKSTHNVNLNTVIGYSKDGKHTNFLDEY
ncbi:MAG: tRNA 2-thiocytidine biosynthesis protein TtcA [Clostridia bacterium]|nr:tRNA 2-thiocytidine biosynthesis protein TtcA [Clostridia bacterium]